MNNEVMFSSKTCEWETPQAFFDALNDEFHLSVRRNGTDTPPRKQ